MSDDQLSASDWWLRENYLFGVGRFEQSKQRQSLLCRCLKARTEISRGIIEYLESNYQQSAVDLARMTISYIQKASTLAAAFAQLEQEDAARAATQELWTLSEEIPSCPTGTDTEDWRAFWHRAYPYLQNDALEHVLEGISKVELPT